MKKDDYRKGKLRKLDTFRHEYRLKWWAQAWYLALGVFFCVLGGHGIPTAITDSDWSLFENWRDSLASVASLALGFYFVALALRSRVVLEATRITVRYSIREKSADISAIAGHRAYKNETLSFLRLQQHMSFWHLQLKGGGDYISIMQLFSVDTYFHSWLHQLPDLDRGNLSA